jgi:hypothetical protein
MELSRVLHHTVSSRIVRAICSVTGITSVIACGWSGSTPVAVPELDRGRPFADVIPSDTAQVYYPIDRSATLLRLNGEPTYREDVKDGRIGFERWVYATRSFSPKGSVPAALLRIEFDAADVVADWYFLDPQSNQQLPIRETVAQAARTFGHPRMFCAAAPIRVVDLESGLRRHVATRTAVGELIYPLATPRVQSGGSGVVWEFYVDRPSAAFVPATLWMYEIGPDGKLVREGVGAPRGGCE